MRSLSLVLLLATAARAATPSDVDMVVGAAGGALVIRHAFGTPVLVTPSVSAGGVTRHTGTQPGFDAVDPLTEAEPGFQPVKDGVPLRVEVVAADPDVSFKLGATVLAAPGDVALLGTAPNLHVHGEWRLELPDGAIGSRTFTFRLITSSPAYAPSPAYAFTVTNDPDAPPVTTTTTTLVPGGATPLAGRRLVLVDGRRLALQSADAPGAVPLAGGVDDPSRAGGTLRVGTWSRPLPAAGWRALPRGAGWRFAGDGVRVLVKRGKPLRIAVRGADAPVRGGDAVDVALTLGTRGWCLRFGGTVRTTSRKLVATAAAAPAACTP